MAESLLTFLLHCKLFSVVNLGKARYFVLNSLHAVVKLPEELPVG